MPVLQLLNGSKEPWYQRGRLILTADTVREKRLALGVPGANPMGGAASLDVSYPAEPLVIDDLRAAFGPALQLHTTAAHWYHFQKEIAERSLWMRTVTADHNRLPKQLWELYPYQDTGVWWMKFVERGILGDDPGLGKTAQAITAVRDKENVLIATLAGVKSHWAEQISYWAKGVPFMVAEGDHQQRQLTITARQSGWLIVNHEMLRVNGRPAYRDLLDRKWDAVILDEAHKFQGRDSQQSKGAARLRSDMLLMLTGSPIWNKPDSIWNLLHLLYPARFSSYWRFVEEYCDVSRTPFGLEIVGVNASQLDRLRSIITPLLLRRRKQEVLPQLPKKIRQVVHWTPSTYQLTEYRRIRKSLTLNTPEGDTAKTYANVVASLSSARMLLNSPMLVTVTAPSPKDWAIQELLDTVMGEHRKVIIFTWHRDYARYLGKLLEEHGTVVVTGDTSERDVLIQNFRTNDYQHILVATIGAAGTGINLIEATAAIFAEGAYVPTLNLQAEDRLHRIGQKTDVMIYRLAAAKTVEAAIWNLADDREEITDEVLAFREILSRIAEDEG